ncbi:hypothetical protein F5Y09DRAFT_334570 [Xylaria sp. FL1042]|nr:hypothetical protein F5Y09DRAFT_334570 [Xylaria sp. FL1042]
MALRTPGKLVIGVETEAPLTIHGFDENSTEETVVLEKTAALNALAELFNKNGLNAYADAVDAMRNHSQWGVTEDPTIEVRGELMGCKGSPVEIKSPPMTIDTPDYEHAFRQMWNIIEPLKMPSVEYWKMADHHIHFSLLGATEFPLDIAQKLAFCVVYFEKAFDELNPTMTDPADKKRPGGWRKCDRYKKRNRVRPVDNGRMPLNDLPSCWASIRATRTIKSLSDLIGLRHTTIEFRHMPATRSAQETLDWITFTSKFVEAAEKVDKVKLDMAAEKQISFLEALEFELNGTREAQLEYEAEWAADPDNCPISHQELQLFMNCDLEFWTRILGVRDRLEKDLARLPLN